MKKRYETGVNLSCQSGLTMMSIDSFHLKGNSRFVGETGVE